MNWITKNIFEFLKDAVEKFLDFVSDSINAMFQFAVTACDSQQVSDALAVTTGIAITLVIAMVLKQLFSVYVMETDGDPDSDPLQLLVKGSEALALIACNGFIFNFLLNLSTRFSKELSRSPDVHEVTVVIANVISNLIPGNIILPIFLIVVIILVIILGIKAGIRGVELSLMKILFPLLCIDLIGTGRERWNNFMASYLIVFFGYALQVFCIQMFLANFAGGDTLASYAIGLVWMFMSIKTPEWLQKYAYTTGIAKTAGGAARSAPFLVMQMMRK